MLCTLLSTICCAPNTLYYKYCISTRDSFCYFCNLASPKAPTVGSVGPKNIVSAGLNTQSQAINHSIDTIFKDIASIEVYQESNVQPQ